MENELQTLDLTLITPTTCSDTLIKCVESVQNQDMENFIHLVVVDGAEHTMKMKETNFQEMCEKRATCFQILPWPTGKNNFNGHRIYGGFSYLLNTKYIAWLDEDNWIEPNHLSSLYNMLEANNLDWGHSLRKVVSPEGEFVCNDDCESLGGWPTCINTSDHLIDVSCFMMRTQLAVSVAPLWYRQARAPNTVPADRAITEHLLKTCGNFGYTGQYTVNYRVGNRSDSVGSDFFINGNETHGKKYPKDESGSFPWNKM